MKNMARLGFNLFLVKLNRLSAWFLLGFVLTYLVTGLALSGELNVDAWIDRDRALALHKSFVWPLAGLVLLHALLSIYFAMRRWGWIGRKTRT